jgi:hypothetical protein
MDLDNQALKGHSSSNHPPSCNDTETEWETFSLLWDNPMVYPQYGGMPIRMCEICGEELSTIRYWGGSCSESCHKKLEAKHRYSWEAHKETPEWYAFKAPYRLNGYIPPPEESQEASQEKDMEE